MARKSTWAPFPHAAKAFTYPGDALKKSWDALHRGDCEPFPKDPDVQEAWRLVHQGKFAEAHALGLQSGGAGVTVANKAQAIYANSLEPKESTKIALFEEVMKRAEAQAKSEPKNPNAHYQYAYAAGRYSQRISVAKALARGYGGKIRAALEAALRLAPQHAEAHIAMGAYTRRSSTRSERWWRAHLWREEGSREEHSARRSSLLPIPHAHIERPTAWS